jgi:D-alanyl-D-alanine carboxypeptidase
MLRTDGRALCRTRASRARWRTVAVTACLAGAACGQGGASPEPSLRAELQRANAAVVAAGAPGALVLASGPGGGVLGFAAGSATLEPPVAMRPDTAQHVGSLTKTFTAVLVLQLVDDGLLRLDDTIAAYVPPGLVPDADRITVRQLLQHTSGLHDYFDVGTESGPGAVWQPLQRDPSFVWTPAALVALGVSAGPDFAPGERASYSNTGYILLGMIVEALRGAPLAGVYEERVFAPLGLRDTAFPSAPGDAAPGQAHCYTRFLAPDAAELEDVNDLDPSFAWAAGAIVSTPRDVARFYAALLLEGALLSPAARREMTSSVVPTAQEGTYYGLGVFRTGEGERQLWWHNGSWPGCTATAGVLTEQDVVVVQLQNVGAADETDALTSAISAELAAAFAAAGGSP